MLPTHQAIANALQNENATQALNQLIDEWRQSEMYSDAAIVSELSGFYTRSADEKKKALALEQMQNLSPHLKKTEGQPDERIQKIISETLQNADPVQSLRTTIARLRKEVSDDSGLLFELYIWRHANPERSEPQEDALIDVLSDLWGW
jgi:hypothetical protein